MGIAAETGECQKFTSDELQQHQRYMLRAIELAEKAQEISEVPVGAVLVHQGEIIAEAFNQTISLSDPTAHAEILVLRQGARVLQNYRLIDTTLYTSLEPCCMCAGALVHARVARLFFAAFDPKAGACGSILQVAANPALNHRTESHGGIYQDRSSQLLKNFFKARRKNIPKPHGNALV